ncbi:MAG: DUF2961 domain-containing protein [Planctomycetes bacterium]|nr:DUF2961 domain-containing protein [Planctomycetota bacterium]
MNARRVTAIWSTTVLSLIASNAAGAAADAGGGKDRVQVRGIEELYRLDLLPRLRPFAGVGCVASYDPTGGNDDGFSGKYSFIRKEDGGFVIAELEGPGAITRFLMSRPTDGVIEFTFDGEASPRLRRKIPELFEGTHPPFLSPLVGTEAGGRYSYVPLAFQRSCKIVVQTGVVHFFQINHVRYPDDAAVPTYQDPPSDDFLRQLDEVRTLLRSAGSDISSYLVSEGARIETQTCRKTLAPGTSITVFDKTGPGRIVGLRLGPAAAFAGPDRDILIRIYWDGDRTPAVSCPVGDFFGYSFGEPAVRSLLLGTSGGANYIYMPMPFERSARIELVSERTSGPAVEVQADVALASPGKADDEGRFYAHWRRENPTRQGQPYTFLKATGRGHVIGMILQAQGRTAGHTGFFEGDDLAVIDGEIVARGTGSEETFNGGWYDVPGRWENRTSLPLSGCLEYKKFLGRTGGYRWMIADCYAYRESIDFTIEHGPEGNRIPTDYTSVTFFYSLEPPGIDSSVPSTTDRKVSAPERIVFVPGWNVPIRTFSLQNATLAKQVATIGDRQVRHLAFRATGRDVFGPHHVSFICEMPAAGRYRIGLKALCGPDQGIVQLFQHDRPAGTPVNLYAEERRASDLLSLGVLDMAAGDNAVFIVLTGKDERSHGLGLDAVELVFEREK